jgi:hypothetical protein
MYTYTGFHVYVYIVAKGMIKAEMHIASER